MIEFRCRRVDRRNRNTPIISDKELDEFAQAVLADYKPQLLKEPAKIKYEHFIESYLGANLEYHDIYNDDPERPIWGATAFNDEELRIFNREKMCISKINVPARTVILDNSIMEPGKEGLALFTGLHEGGHVLIHPNVFTHMLTDQISLLEAEPISPVVCCRRENIENFGAAGAGKRTPEQWREHHADYFAAAIAMPNRTFSPTVHQLLRENGFYKTRIITGIDEDQDYIAEELLPEAISEIYGVSKKAAFVKLKKSGFVIDRKSYDRQNAQLTI